MEDHQRDYVDAAVDVVLQVHLKQPPGGSCGAALGGWSHLLWIWCCRGTSSSRQVGLVALPWVGGHTCCGYDAAGAPKAAAS